MTKEEKVARFQKLNQDIRKGQILCAGSSLMEMFPVEKFVKEDTGNIGVPSSIIVELAVILQTNC